MVFDKIDKLNNKYSQNVHWACITSGFGTSTLTDISPVYLHEYFSDSQGVLLVQCVTCSSSVKAKTDTIEQESTHFSDLPLANHHHNCWVLHVNVFLRFL